MQILVSGDKNIIFLNSCQSPSSQLQLVVSPEVLFIKTIDSSRKTEDFKVSSSLGDVVKLENKT